MIDNNNNVEDEIKNSRYKNSKLITLFPSTHLIGIYFKGYPNYKDNRNIEIELIVIDIASKKLIETDVTLKIFYKLIDITKYYSQNNDINLIDELIDEKTYEIRTSELNSVSLSIQNLELDQIEKVGSELIIEILAISDYNNYRSFTEIRLNPYTPPFSPSSLSSSSSSSLNIQIIENENIINEENNLSVDQVEENENQIKIEEIESDGEEGANDDLRKFQIIPPKNGEISGNGLIFIEYNQDFHIIHLTKNSLDNPLRFNLNLSNYYFDCFIRGYFFGTKEPLKNRENSERYPGRSPVIHPTIWRGSKQAKVNGKRLKLSIEIDQNIEKNLTARDDHQQIPIKIDLKNYKGQPIIGEISLFVTQSNENNRKNKEKQSEKQSLDLENEIIKTFFTRCGIDEKRKAKYKGYTNLNNLDLSFNNELKLEKIEQDINRYYCISDNIKDTRFSTYRRYCNIRFYEESFDGFQPNIITNRLRNLISQSQVALVFFDLTNEISFNLVPDIISNLRNLNANFPIILVGNKLDLIEETDDEMIMLDPLAKQLAESLNIPYITMYQTGIKLNVLPAVKLCFDIAKCVIEGILVIGAPNVGKSTFCQYLHFDMYYEDYFDRNVFIFFFFFVFILLKLFLIIFIYFKLFLIFSYYY